MKFGSDPLVIEQDLMKWISMKPEMNLVDSYKILEKKSNVLGNPANKF